MPDREVRTFIALNTIQGSKLYFHNYNVNIFYKKQILLFPIIQDILSMLVKISRLTLILRFGFPDHTSFSQGSNHISALLNKLLFRDPRTNCTMNVFREYSSHLRVRIQWLSRQKQSTRNSGMRYRKSFELSNQNESRFRHFALRY